MSKKKKEEQEDAMKVITLGESKVGKTCIIRRYIHKIFDDNNLSTIGYNTTIKNVELKNGKTIKIDIIDTAGQERYRSLAKSYFKNADAVLFIFSLNDQESFDNIINWINLFNENHNGKKGIPRYLVGNKSDLEKKVQKDVIDKLLCANKYKYYETSAKSNSGIDELFQELSEDLYKILVETGGNNKSQNSKKLSKYKKKTKKGLYMYCNTRIIKLIS